MKSFGLWILALVVTLASAVYQKKTGPTYPVSGSAEIAETTFKYKLTRTHAGAGDQPIEITIPDNSVSATLVYKRYPTDDPWTHVEMQREGDLVKASLPHQLPAGKIEYYVQVEKEGKLLSIPGNESIITRFRGEVPAAVLIPHILFMFLGMLFSTRVGLEAIRKDGNITKLVFWTTGLIIIGGMILGPMVQKFGFGAYWTGFPYGTDLTDNKTLIALIGWLIAVFGVIKNKKPRLLTVLAAIVTLLVFMIPHSMAGSQLDYSTVESSNFGQQVQAEAGK